MNVKLTHHAEELLQAVRAQRNEPAELIVERALESFVREQNVAHLGVETSAVERQAVNAMLDFVRQNRVRLEPSLSVKEFIREGQRL